MTFRENAELTCKKRVAQKQLEHKQQSRKDAK